MSGPYRIAAPECRYGGDTQSNTITYIAKPSFFFVMSENFQDRIRKARENLKLSQSELAAKAKMQPAAISHFETGQRSPSFDNLRKLSDALNVSVDYLLGRIDEEQHGMGMSAAPRAKQLFRHAENLSDESFEILEMMARALKDKEDQKKDGGAK